MMAWVFRIWSALVLAMALSGPAAPQDALIENYSSWSLMADQAERALESGVATETRLSRLRARLVDYRSQFEAATDQNAARIATLREQIAALGTPPETETDPPEDASVAATRAELNQQLAALLVPVQRAEAEFVRADALVTRIDAALREYHTRELLSTTPSPLNPANWAPALAQLKQAVQALWQQAPGVRSVYADAEMRSALPVAILFAILGLVLIWRGRHWSLMIATSLRRFGAAGYGIWRFLASFLRIILPFVGLVLLALAGISTQFFGPKVDEILLLIALLGGIMLGVRWVAERVFSRDDDEALLRLAPAQRSAMRFHIGTITILIVAGALITETLDAGNPDMTAEAVLTFPITVLAAFSLYRIGQLLRRYDEAPPDEAAGAEARSSTLVRVVRGLGTGAIAVAILAPLLAATGYYRAADALLPPYIMTLVILGLVMALQRFAADVHGAVTGQGAQAREALMPVLFGMVLLILAGPVLALIWGARPTDLSELWARFLRGFAVGDSRVSPADFLTFAVIFAIGYVLTRLVQSALRSNVLPKTQMDIGGQNAVVSGLGYVGIFLAALAAITGAGIDLSSLAIVAGALSVGIGFGLQNIVSNFVSGIILLIERPISEGDWIEVGGQMGYVRDISVRSTRIETFDRSDVIVPNADLVSGTVTNYTRGNTVGRVIIQIGVAYGTDTRKVDKILREIAEAQPMVLANPPPAVVFAGIGASTYDFEIRAILRDVNWMMSVKNDINHAIVERFEQEGIEMAFPQQDIWIRNFDNISLPQAVQPADPEETKP